MKFTKHTLKKVEDLFDELDYEIIYAGYCLVESQKKVVINRYFEVEARINCLADILSGFTIEEDALSDKSSDFLKKLLLTSAESKEGKEKEALHKEETESLAVEENKA